jgi:excisionase family DNA binding protein
MTRSRRIGSTTSTGELPTLIDAEVLAQTWGVPARHVRRLVEERRIPFVRIGRYVRFDIEQLAIWIDANRVDQYRPAPERKPSR